MPARRRHTLTCVTAFAVVATVVVAVGGAAVSQAAPATWSGRYRVVTFASEKLGTSVAARQPEPDFSAEYTFVTACGTTCVATATGGPAPSNPTIPQPSRYAFDGRQWVFDYTWQWECFRGNDVPSEYATARSRVFYAPNSDGTMFGSWRTDILQGICQGTVIMPVAAYPA